MTPDSSFKRTRLACGIQILTVFLMSPGLGAQESSAAPPDDSLPPSSTQHTESDEKLVDFVGMKVNPTRRTIHVPVEINMTEGFIEYVLVHENGKTHESIFRTGITGEKFNAALLLFLPKERGLPVETLNNIRIELFIVWEDDRKVKHRVPVDQWVLNNILQKPMKPGPWGYVGSRFEDGVYVASRDGSLIAVREDSDTVIGNPRPERTQDDIWKAAVPDPWEPGQSLTLEVVIPKPTN